jgi:hypothetical protein
MERRRLKVRLKLVRADCCPQNAGERNTETVKPSALLLKEMEETNHWVRLAFQLYFGWFALQFTVNAVAMGWLFAYKGSLIPAVARLIFFIFVGWNLMGTITTFLIRKHMLACDRRIQEVLEGLTRHRVPEGHYSDPQSPVPRNAIKTVFILCAITMFISLSFWMTLAIWPRIILT